MPYEYFQGTPGAAAQRLRRQLDALSDCRGPHVFDAEDVRLVLEYLEANERARLAEHEALQPAVRTGSDRLSEAAPPVNAVARSGRFPSPDPGRGRARKPPSVRNRRPRRGGLSGADGASARVWFPHRAATIGAHAAHEEDLHRDPRGRRLHRRRDPLPCPPE